MNPIVSEKSDRTEWSAREQSNRCLHVAKSQSDPKSTPACKRGLYLAYLDNWNENANYHFIIRWNEKKKPLKYLFINSTSLGHENIWIKEKRHTMCTTANCASAPNFIAHCYFFKNLNRKLLCSCIILLLCKINIFFYNCKLHWKCIKILSIQNKMNCLLAYDMNGKIYLVLTHSMTFSCVYTMWVWDIPLFRMLQYILRTFARFD